MNQNRSGKGASQKSMNSGRPFPRTIQIRVRGIHSCLSAPLAELLKAERMSRPQVVKHLWIYIKANNLQNPEDRREIICDDNMKAIFQVDRLGMFKMNKVLGE